MKVHVYINYNSEDGRFYLSVDDKDGNRIPDNTCRTYAYENEAEIAAIVLRWMYLKIDNVEEFDVEEFNYMVSQILISQTNRTK